jgi:hypothetical protein
MNSDAAFHTFQRMLTAAGHQAMNPEPMVIWSAFRLFLYEVSDKDTGPDRGWFLVEWGHAADNDRNIYLNFARMFPIYVSGSLQETLEIRCDLLCKRHDEIASLTQRAGPSATTRSLPRAIFSVECQDDFRALLRWRGPWTAEVYKQAR